MGEDPAQSLISLSGPLFWKLLPAFKCHSEKEAALKDRDRQGEVERHTHQGPNQKETSKMGHEKI